jgi:hypothetical protein
MDNIKAGWTVGGEGIRFDEGLTEELEDFDFTSYGGTVEEVGTLSRGDSLPAESPPAEHPLLQLHDFAKPDVYDVDCGESFGLSFGEDIEILSVPPPSDTLKFLSILKLKLLRIGTWEATSICLLSFASGTTTRFPI